MLRGLKTTLDRQTLNTMYLSFIRPLFEYASVVWHNAPRLGKYFEDLEQLQIESARVVTGTNRYASKELLYTETAWDTFLLDVICKEFFFFSKFIMEWHHNIYLTLLILIQTIFEHTISDFLKTTNIYLRGQNALDVPFFLMQSDYGTD